MSYVFELSINDFQGSDKLKECRLPNLPKFMFLFLKNNPSPKGKGGEMGVLGWRLPVGRLHVLIFSNVLQKAIGGKVRSKKCFN
jgi:hypothetical protein